MPSPSELLFLGEYVAHCMIVSLSLLLLAHYHINLHINLLWGKLDVKRGRERSFRTSVVHLFSR